MITGAVFLVLLATVPLCGGRLSLLGEIRLRSWWSIAASLVIQVVLIEVLAGSFGGVVAAALHLLSYVFAFVFVWHNRQVVGMGVIVLGGVLNAAAISANGGVMPARLEALETAGIVTDSPTFENSAPVANARLAFLGDVFAIPEGIPFANVFSVGDVLLVLGAGVTVHVVGESSVGRRLRRLSLADSDLADLVPAAMIEGPSAAAMSAVAGSGSATLALDATDSAAGHQPGAGSAAEGDSLARRYERSVASRRRAAAPAGGQRAVPVEVGRR